MEWKLEKRNQGVHTPAKQEFAGHLYTVFAINTSNDRSSREHLVLEAQYQQLTPFTSIVPLNFEAATVSHNPEGFTAPVKGTDVQGSRCSVAVGLYVHATS